MRSKSARIALMSVGALVLLFAYVAWAVEREYGSDTNFELETDETGTTIVYDVDEQAGTRTVVFEGSIEEAQAYVDDRREQGKSFVVPGSLLALGAALLLLGLRPPGQPSSRRAPS